MIIAKSIEALQEAKEQLNGSIGFVPTMGCIASGTSSIDIAGGTLFSDV